MICPKCKCEYRKEFAKCTDCGCKLIKSKSTQISTRKKQDVLDKRWYVKLTFLSLPIILGIILIGVYDKLNAILQTIAALSIPTITIVGGILSLRLKIPIYGWNVLTLLASDKDDFSFFDGLSSIIVIIISIVFIINIIK